MRQDAIGAGACHQGDNLTALAVVQRGQQLAHGDPWIDGWNLAWLGHAHLESGVLGKARSALEGALMAAERNGSPHSLTPQIFDSLGELEIACNNPRLAHEWLVRGLEFRHDSLASGRALDLEDAIAFALSSRGESAPAARASAASLLTTREREVARLLARGFSNRQIADELVISLHTAQRHVENILGKHGFSSRAQVAAWAVGEGLSGEAPRP